MKEKTEDTRLRVCRSLARLTPHLMMTYPWHQRPLPSLPLSLNRTWHLAALFLVKQTEMLQRDSDGMTHALFEINEFDLCQASV